MTSEQWPQEHSETSNELIKWMNESINTLRASFGITDLSIIERFRIKKITEDVLKRFDPTQHMRSSEDAFSIDKEVVTRFLIEAYGIDPDYINKYTETDEDDEEFNEYIRRVRAKAHLL